MRLSVDGTGAPALPSLRLNRALLFSLLVHTLLLCLTFGDGLGRERRSDAPDLRVVLEPAPGSPPPPPAVDVPAAAPAEASRQPAVDDGPPDSGTALLAAVHSPADWAVPAASAVQRDVALARPGPAAPVPERSRRPDDTPGLHADAHAPNRVAALAELDVAREAMAPAAAVPTLAAASTPAVVPLRRSGDARTPRSDREVHERSAELAQLDVARQSMTPVAAVSVLAAASAPELESLRRGTDTLRPHLDRERSTDLAQLDSVRQDMQRSVLQLAAARQEAERQEAARQEAARQEAARQQAARQEAARQPAAQAEAARLDAERREAARVAAIRQEGLRLEAARLAAAEALAQAEAEQREARLRAIGRQLDEEAARRDAQRPVDRQRPDWTPARRGRLYSRSDANAELTQYGELWARKIQFNQTFDLVRDAATQPHGDPVVTVAVRSNGSVESITFVRSSGVPALDEAIRRVVHSQENYPAFPAGLLRDFDVVEIRRTWRFDVAIRLD